MTIHAEEFRALQALGAGEFAHINGSLLKHLAGTEALLQSWGARPALCRAGLFHAAYSTDGFEQALIGHDSRERIAAIVGAEAEAIIYTYCACDRNAVWPQFGHGQPITFQDRFSAQSYPLSEIALRDFCELTAANELELAIHSEAMVQAHGTYLLDLFTRMSSYLSGAANREVARVLGDISLRQP